MTKVSELVSQNVGNQIINYQTWGGVIFNSKVYGAKGDGTTNDTVAIAAAITAAAVTGGIVMFPPGTFITDNQTVPANVTLWFANGAKLSINTGTTVTINGYVDAGMYQIFSGLGKIIGKMTNPVWFPHWWGAKGDATNDDAPAINALIASAQSGNYPAVIKFPAAPYLIKSSIIIKHGTVEQNINLEGYGSRLLAGTSGMKMITVVAFGDPASFSNIGLTRIAGFKMYGGGAGSTCIFIGKQSSSSTDYGLSGTFPSIIEDISMENMETGINLSSSRLWQFNRIGVSTAVANARGIFVNSLYDSFAGDSWISNSNFGMPASGIGIYIRATSVSGTSKIAGVHISHCVCYGYGISIETTNSPSDIQDIFIDNCAMDGADAYAGISISGIAGATIIQILITDTWINAFQYGMVITLATGITFIGGKFSSIDNIAVLCDTSNSCIMNGTRFNDCNKLGNGGGIIKLTGAGRGNKVISCDFFNTSYTNQFIDIGASQVKPVVTLNTKDATGLINNHMAGVEGTAFIVSNNLS